MRLTLRLPTDPDPINVDQETLVLRWAGYSPPYRYLYLHLLSINSTDPHESASTSMECSLPRRRVHSFGDTLDARLLSAQNCSTSELLRTL